MRAIRERAKDICSHLKYGYTLRNHTVAVIEGENNTIGARPCGNGNDATFPTMNLRAEISSLKRWHKCATFVANTYCHSARLTVN